MDMFPLIFIVESDVLLRRLPLLEELVRLVLGLLLIRYVGGIIIVIERVLFGEEIV